MKRIDLLVSPHSYTLQNCAATCLQKAFHAHGIETRRLDPATALRSFHRDPPACSLSFVDYGGAVAHVPHFLWQLGCPTPTLHVLKNPLVHLGIQQQFFVQKLPHERLFFLPSCADAALLQEPPMPKIYDVVIFDSLKCLDTIQATWREIFPTHVVEHLLEAIINPDPLAYLLSIQTPYTLCTLLSAVHEYLHSQHLLSAISTIENKEVHLFGDHIGNQWLKKLKNASHVHLHSTLPYIDHFKILRQSKILLTEEWVFPAILCNCLPITSTTDFLHQAFDGVLPFYPQEKWEAMHAMIHYYLDFQDRREELLKTLQVFVNQRHTFNSRARTLLEYASCLPAYP